MHLFRRSIFAYHEIWKPTPNFPQDITRVSLRLSVTRSQHTAAELILGQPPADILSTMRILTLHGYIVRSEDNPVELSPLSLPDFQLLVMSNILPPSVMVRTRAIVVSINNPKVKQQKSYETIKSIEICSFIK